MALVSSRIPGLTKHLCIYRSIMTSNSRVQKVMEDLQQNPYFDKYSKKIADLKKSAPEQFMERIEERHQAHEDLKGKVFNARRYESVLKPKEERKDTTPPVQKQLEDIFKIELVIDKSPEEIRKIWLKYHILKDVIAATIPAEAYEKVVKRMKRYPTFLFPLPRSEGYEYIMSQAIGNEVHFTTLLCYQGCQLEVGDHQIISILDNAALNKDLVFFLNHCRRFFTHEVHKENAPECLTMVHYQELAADKGLVLMRGEFDKNVLDAQQAQCLANQFQMYYGQDHPTKLDLLDSFTKRPEEFKHDMLITELENLTLT